jgi:hypothetical protein
MLSEVGFGKSSILLSETSSLLQVMATASDFVLLFAQALVA